MPRKTGAGAMQAPPPCMTGAMTIEPGALRLIGPIASERQSESQISIGVGSALLSLGTQSLRQIVRQRPEVLCHDEIGQQPVLTPGGPEKNPFPTENAPTDEGTCTVRRASMRAPPATRQIFDIATL